MRPWKPDPKVTFEDLQHCACGVTFHVRQNSLSFRFELFSVLFSILLIPLLSFYSSVRIVTCGCLNYCVETFCCILRSSYVD